MYLNSSLGQVESHCQIFPGKNVGVLCFFKCGFQLVKLKCGERRTRSSDFSRPVGFAEIQWIAQSIVQLMVTAQLGIGEIGGIGRRRVIWIKRENLRIFLKAGEFEKWLTIDCQIIQINLLNSTWELSLEKLVKNLM